MRPRPGSGPLDLSCEPLDLGGISIRFALDMVLRLPAGLVFPDAVDLPFKIVELPVGSHLVEVQGQKILVDAGVGEGKPRPRRPGWGDREGTGFLDRLGIDPGDIDIVVLTHLHADHVGWATLPDAGGWRPTFPNARHLIARSEMEHWQRRLAETAGPDLVNHGSFADSVVPLLARGLVDLVDPPVAIGPGLSLEPLPGHCPGMMGLRVQGSRRTALLAADVFHHPVQLDRPDLVSAFCENPSLARVTRARVLEAARREGTILIPSHCPPLDLAKLA